MKQRPRTRETKQRRVVYETIKNTYSHPTADWIFEKVRHRLPKVSLGTVYRNLGVLKEEGLVSEIYGNDRRAHFDADTSPHAHFICIGDRHRPPHFEGARLQPEPSNGPPGSRFSPRVLRPTNCYLAGGSTRYQ